MTNSPTFAPIQARRQQAMRILAGATSEDLRAVFDQSGVEAEAKMLRGPETGLVTLRGRMGGGGAQFNIGEATVTRATVKLETGEVGHAYHLGRDAERVRIAAIIDALMQRVESADLIEQRVLSLLKDSNAARDSRKRAETAATKVDFFTMVRGED